MIKQSKYPEIIIDKDNNSVNKDHNIVLTVEQYYDLLHHTHNTSDIIGSESSMQTISEVQENILQLKNTIASLKLSIDEIKQQLNDMNEDVNDYDVLTAGIQDITGNTIEP